MAVNLKGLSDNSRKTAISELNARLADGLSLAMALKQAHWNVRGPNFIAIHELFDTVYDNLQGHLDEIAERIQTLDGTAKGTAEVVAEATTLDPYPTDFEDTEDHLREICSRMREFGAKLRTGIATVEEAGDAGTVDILTTFSIGTDKDLWFLESNLD